MRPIDADALFRKVKTECNPYGKPTIGFEDGKKVMDWIEQAPTVNNWISVKDRPPKKSGWYLVSLVNTRTGHRWEVPVPADYSHGKWDYAYLGEGGMLNNTVTHWMPCPKPPEESKNG